jgi:hypothetical protein
MPKPPPKPGAWHRFLAGWEVKQNILRPLIVNLLTAATLFLAAIALKKPVYDLFTSPPAVNDWPLYCVLQPRVSKGGNVTADLFIINVGNANYGASDLADLAKKRSVADRREVSPAISIVMKPNLAGESIRDVQADREFNNEQGSVTLSHPDATHWMIQVEQIKVRAMLKLTVVTTVDRPVSSRASLETLPIQVLDARSE